MYAIRISYGGDTITYGLVQYYVIPYIIMGYFIFLLIAFLSPFKFIHCAILKSNFV